MAPKTNFQLDPQQQENWEKNVPYLLSLSKTVRILQGFIIFLFCFSVYRGKINSPWQIFAFCATLLLSVLFSELFRNNLKKNRSPYLPSLYILGVICCIGSPILIIVNRLPDSVAWDLYTILSLIFGVLSIVPSLYFLFVYKRNKKFSKTIWGIVSFFIVLQSLLIFPITIFDIYHFLVPFLILLINFLEFSLITLRNGKMNHKKRM